MATIASLKRVKDQPPVTRTGNSLSSSEVWCLHTANGNLTANTGSSMFEAEGLISALVDGNPYTFPIVGGLPISENSGVYATGYDIDRFEANAPNAFLVTVDLTNDITLINKSSPAIRNKPTYQIQNVDTLIEVDIDPITGNAIAATNGEPYFPKLVRKGNDKRFLIGRNERVFNPDQASDYEQKINEFPMQINKRYYPARTLLLESWLGDEAVDVDGTIYFAVKYSFLYNKSGHTFELIDVANGKDLDGTWPQITGKVENKPYKLDGEGLYMTGARQIDASDFETNTFYVNEEIDMKFLRL
jgi:hypothetical protein